MVGGAGRVGGASFILVQHVICISQITNCTIDPTIASLSAVRVIGYTGNMISYYFSRNAN